MRMRARCHHGLARNHGDLLRAVRPFLRPAASPTGAIGSVIALGIICTATMFLLFFVEIVPSRATVITYVNTVVAIYLGVILLDEPLTLGMAIGFPLVIIGSILATARAKPS
jgi:drug/metabolite transporter (DMT)-like permease